MLVSLGQRLPEGDLLCYRKSAIPSLSSRNDYLARTDRRTPVLLNDNAATAMPCIPLNLS
jgi:hypothetical protein